MALRDAGAEVVYLGLRRTAAEIVQAARDEDADVIGISILSGAHGPLVTQLLEERAARGVPEIPIVIGGTVPDADAARLRELGVAAVVPVGTPLAEAVAAILDLARERAA
jgi:methylmalonyl-CoA mutase, C-terminal domain